MKRKLSTGLHSYDVPSDWDIEPIGHLLNIETGARNTQDRVSGGKFPFFVRSQTVERINTYSFDGEAVLTAGDGVGTGKVFHYINGKFDCHQRVYRMSEFAPELDGRYFFWFFSRFFYERVISMTAKSSVDSVRRDMIFEMEIALPTYAEQKGIAQSLDDIDMLLECLDKLIAKKKDIKQGAMQQLLTGKTRLPGFSGVWQPTSLKLLGSVYSGLTGKSKQHFGTGGANYIPFVNVMANLRINSNALEKVEIGENESQNLVRFGDLIFNGSSETPEEVALCSAVDYEPMKLYLNSFCFGFHPFSLDQMDSVFFAYLFRSSVGRQMMVRLAQGSTRYNISKQKFLSEEFLVPGKHEQEAIAKVLSDMDAEIDALVARRDKTALIKTGMMQELLTGRTRLL